MKNIRICAVVTGKTRGEFLGNLEKIQEVADLVELRVDYIEGFSVNDIDLIKRKSYGADCKSAPAKIKYIFTCRKKEEGGFFQGKEEERVMILKKAMESGFDYVDVELSTVVSNPSLPPLIRGGGRTSVILSFHDFQKTPLLGELEEIKKQMRAYNADIMKFATFVRDEADSKILFKFLLDKEEDEEMIVVGMGERGRMTRIVAPLLGSYLTYASTDYSKLAEGQIEIQELKKLYNMIGEDYGWK